MMRSEVLDEVADGEAAYILEVVVVEVRIVKREITNGTKRVITAECKYDTLHLARQEFARIRASIKED